MKTLLILLIFFIALLPNYAQNLNGIVLEQETDNPVSYASIGIINKNGGTYSDIDGKFHFVQTDYERSDSLRFSCIGYKSVTYSLSDLIEKYGNSSMRVSMEKQAFRLKGVDIIPHEYKVQEIGNKLSCRQISICARNDKETGIVIRNHKTLFLTKLTFKLIMLPAMPDSVLMRFNIYNLKNDLPSELILEKPVYILLSKELADDKITIDLEKYGIVVNGDFAATIEIIKLYGAEKICFAGWISGNPTVFKYGKQGKWTYPVDDKKTKLKIYQSMYLSVRIKK